MYHRQIGNWGCWSDKWTNFDWKWYTFGDMGNSGFCPPAKYGIKTTKFWKKIFWIDVWGQFVPSKSYKLSDQKKVHTLLYLISFACSARSASYPENLLRGYNQGYKLERKKLDLLVKFELKLN